MTDSENKEKWISIPYLPPPLGSLQAGGLKADNSQDPPLEVNWGGVEGKLAQLSPPIVARHVPNLVRRIFIKSSWTFCVAWTSWSGWRI